MEEIVKSDWFFFITSIAIGVITVLLATMIVYSLFILRNMKKIVNTVKEESEEIIADLHEVRAQLKSQTGVLTKVPAVVMGLMQLFKIKKSKTKTKKNGNKEN
jgi:uncharacterized membrane protein